MAGGELGLAFDRSIYKLVGGLEHVLIFHDIWDNHPN
jgi:hypothetical protein